ncbi:helix-turn-helix transcriptional regulator [Lentzea terrae]|uniref:helix-turn-helix transcriptional regulator n=1 Tax=Lentzea terrae TaxID=2200761 RepID=UPI000DD2E745|nr:LuxR C-terminal-related transcriptional regulator [Lentzea terrae]
MARLSKEQAGERVRRLAGAGLDTHAFFEAAGVTVARAVPIGGAPPFWNTVDPASHLITSVHFEGDCFFDAGEQTRWEYVADDVNKTADVIENPSGVQTLHEVTGGQPERSTVFREYLRPRGIEQEAAVALRDPTGQNWGTLRLNRAPGQPEFDAAELAFLRCIAPHLAGGVRRGLLIGEAAEPDWPDGPGLVVVGDGLALESASPNAIRWLDELNTRDGGVPAAVLSVAARAHTDEERAVARVRAGSGRWFLLHGTRMALPEGTRAAVIIEPVARARIATVLMAAYGLTPREREITRLVLQGLATAKIAEALVISPVTVQQHLKSIFAKTGVHSRRDLVCTVFHDHYEPRVRDNEDRRVAALPARGGPVSPRQG